MADDRDYEPLPMDNIRMGTPEEAEAKRPGFAARWALRMTELGEWFDAGVKLKASHMLVLDTNGTAEPLYVYPPEEAQAGGVNVIARDERGIRAVALGDPDHSLYSRWRARIVLEVYHLGMDKILQIETHYKQQPFTLYIPESVTRPTPPKETFKPAVGLTGKQTKELDAWNDEMLLTTPEESDAADQAFQTAKLARPRRPKSLEELSEKDLKTLEMHVETAAVALRYRNGTTATTWSKDAAKALLELYELLDSVAPKE
jgi:hypothetical protein